MTPDEEYDKVIGQYQLQLGALLRPLRLYGQDVLVDQITIELVTLGVQLHMKLSGVDIPYSARDFSWAGADRD